MEVGLVGADGQRVPKPVIPEEKLECEIARSHPLKMAGKHVQTQQWNAAYATTVLVPVRNVLRY